jgi:hypothetical protein
MSKLGRQCGIASEQGGAITGGAELRTGGDGAGAEFFREQANAGECAVEFEKHAALRLG